MKVLDPNETIDLKSIQKVREIKNEILNFGITQNEILKLIELLSLELEDTQTMKNIMEQINKEITTTEIKKELII